MEFELFGRRLKAGKGKKNDDTKPSEADESINGSKPGSTNSLKVRIEELEKQKFEIKQLREELNRIKSY
ncbi:1890_t:CDS:2 [Funneliformis geosporum]|uniref:1890_t:CDS:1 n=1 Tax=Funneliformis geosporum TaxID=1117311 RepID=A0A9W4WM40_9GLOM|nr:1890_t:CDS:2 [Funneliformis geosporum]